MRGPPVRAGEEGREGGKGGGSWSSQRVVTAPPYRGRAQRGSSRTSSPLEIRYGVQWGREIRMKPFWMKVSQDETVFG